jgi:hypothetical protein
LHNTAYLARLRSNHEEGRIGESRDRQTDRQTGRQTDRQTDRQADRQTDREREREREKIILYGTQELTSTITTRWKCL